MREDCLGGDAYLTRKEAVGSVELLTTFDIRTCDLLDRGFAVSGLALQYTVFVLSQPRKRESQRGSLAYTRHMTADRNCSTFPFPFPFT